MQSDAPSPPPADELDRWRTADGIEVSIRPLRADDGPQELRFIESMSPQTRYERTFSHRKGLLPGELRELIRFDVREQVALVALVRQGDVEEFAAVTRLKKSADGSRFEFAIVVGDAWQRQGIGARLLGKLLEFARRAGVPRIVGCTFATNEAMRSLARKAGFTLRPDPEDASLTVLEIDL